MRKRIRWMMGRGLGLDEGGDEGFLSFGEAVRLHCWLCSDSIWVSKHELFTHYCYVECS